MTAKHIAETYQKVKESFTKLVEKSKKWKNPNSTKTQALSSTKEQATADALRQVRNNGYKRLGALGALGALGLGSYAAYNAGVQPNSESPTPSQTYRFDPKNRWQKNVNGKWVPQQKEFGVDRNGHVNYYDGSNWVSDYIQSSDGTVFNRQGQVIGQSIDPSQMRQAGYSNIFDYQAFADTGSRLTPEQVAAVQQHIGVDADGKWGARTSAAYKDWIRRNGQL